MYGPDVTILLMYGSHDMRHTGFSQVDCGQQDPRENGASQTISALEIVVDLNELEKKVACVKLE